VPIEHTVIADWQRYCAEHPNGQLVLEAADAAELLKAYAELQVSYESRVENCPGVGMCVKLPHHWRVGYRVRAVRMDEKGNVTPFRRPRNT
jgi:hypothetical protein